MIKVIDNFLDEEEFKSIQSFMMGGEFRWFYSEGRVTNDDGLFCMIHMFFQPEVGSNSEHINIWNNFMRKIEATKCYRIKANMTLKSSSQIADDTEWHIDDQGDALKTAVFYINTNDGYTEFKNGVRVNSVANRVCIFDSNLKHSGTTHSEGDTQRIVVNFNYD